MVVGTTFAKITGMAAKEWYKAWFDSSYYHKLYFDRDEQEAEAFMSKLIDHLKPLPNSRMVDIACGKGRHSKFLAAQGFDVTGIDISRESIRYAQQFETENLHYFEHDMRLLFWINYFDYAFNFFTSFGYFNTLREHDDTLRTISGSLKPGGVFVLDYLNVPYVEERLVPKETRQIDDTVYEIQRWVDDRHFFKKIIISDPELPEPMEHIEKVAKFGLADFTTMLDAQKLDIAEVFGDYELNPYNETTSRRLIVLAKKR